MAVPRLLFTAVLVATAVSVLARRDARIVGGKAADISEAPWLVQLIFLHERYSTEWSETPCGGVILDNHHILTVASCFKDEKSIYVAKSEEFTAVLAGNTERYTGGAFKGQFFRIKSVTLSPEYTKRDGVWIFKKGDPKKTSKFDIAVLETLTPIRFNDNVKAIEIATEKPSADTPVFVGGWGVNTTNLNKNYFYNFDSGLKISSAKIMQADKCKQYLTRFPGLDKESQESMICTDNIDGTFCSGDAGSGLWTQEEGQPPRLVGLAQSAESCDLSAHGVFVDVADPQIKKFLKKTNVVA